MKVLAGAALVLYALLSMIGMVIEAFRTQTPPLVRAWRVITVPIVVIAIAIGLGEVISEFIIDRLDDAQLRLEAWSERL